MADHCEFNTLTRRRLISICAGSSVAFAAGMAPADARLATWNGVALGAEAQIKLHHPDATRAKLALQQCLDEIDRLESMFSLYRPDSMLNRLNRDGALSGPPVEMVELVATAQHVSRITDGAFDCTVQPLWQLYSIHHAQPGTDGSGPDAEDIRQALNVIGHRNVAVSSQRIAFKQSGMAMTLNGIAQGFITDRVRSLLNRNGFRNVLVHLGETFGSGSRPDGTPWVAGIAAPDGSERIIRRVRLGDRALATSGGYGHVYKPASADHHIFDPRSGYNPGLRQSVSVISPSAAVADALSTAFCSMTPAQMRTAMDQFTNTTAVVVAQDGSILDV